MWNHYLKIQLSDGAILERIATERTLNTGPRPPRLTYWVPADVVGYEVITDAEVLEGPVASYTPQAARGTLTYTKRAKTAQELDDDKDATVAGIIQGNPLIDAILAVASDDGRTLAQFTTLVRAKL